MVAHARVVGAPSLHSDVVFALGDFGRGRDLGDRVLKTAIAIDHPFSVAFHSWLLARMGAWGHDLGYAERHATLALEIAKVKVKGFPSFAGLAHVTAGWVRACRGEPAAGVAEIRAAIDALTAGGMWCLYTFNVLCLAEARRYAGRPEEALDSVRSALEFATTRGEWLWEPGHRLRGELLLDLSPHATEAAAKELEEAVALARAQGAGGDRCPELTRPVG